MPDSRNSRGGNDQQERETNRFTTYSSYENESSLTNEDDSGSFSRREYSLTHENEDFGDESPLTSRRSSFDGYSDFNDDEEDSLESSSSVYDTRRTRQANRRETIERMSAEYKDGTARSNATNRYIREMPRDPRRQGMADKRRSSQAPRDLQARSAAASRRLQEEKKSNKSKFAAFYIGMLMLAVGVCLAVFFVVLQAVMDRGIGRDILAGQEPDSNIVTSVVPANRPDIRTINGLVIGTSITNPRNLMVLDINNRHNRQFTVPDSAEINNRTGHLMTFYQLRAGQLLDISYNARSSEITAIRESTRAWERRARTNVIVDLEEATITSGNDVFDFNSHTLVLRDGEPFPISQISELDTVTLSGFGSDVWMVQLELSHGFLQITNTDMIVNGRMHVGNNHFPDLEDIDERIPLSEGTHRVVVDGDNIETFVENVSITQGQTTTVNLGDAELRNALLHVITNPPEAEVFVNGELHEESGPIHISFGENVIRVEAYGYIPQEQTIDVTLPMSSVQFELVEITRRATIVIFSQPTNAQIFIDNVFVGYSPVTQDIAPGTRVIEARLAGHNDTRVERTIGPEEEDFLSLILTTAVGDTNDPLQGQPNPIPDMPVNTPVPPLGTPAPLPTIPPGTPDTPGAGLPPVNPLPTPVPDLFAPQPLPTAPPGDGFIPLPPAPDLPAGIQPIPTAPPAPDLPAGVLPLPTIPPAMPPTTPGAPAPTPWNPFVPT